MTEIEFTDEEIATMAYDYSYDAAIRAKFVLALPPERVEALRGKGTIMGL